MPIFEVTNPQGKKYRVNAPDGATQDDAIRYIASQQSQPQQPTDFAANPRQLKEGEGSDFFRGIGQYTDQYGGIMGGAKMLAGKLTGSDDLIESGLKQYRKSEAAVGKRGVKKTDSFTGALDEGLGAVLTEFIPYIAGQGVGMIGEAFLTAGAGALVGGAAAPGVGAAPGLVSGFIGRKFLKDGILDEAKKLSGTARKEFLRNEVAKQLATTEGRDLIKKGFSDLGKTSGLTYMAGKFGAGEITGRAVDEALAANPDSTDQLEIIKGLNTGKLAALSAGHALADYFFLKIGLGSLDALPTAQANRVAAIFTNIGVTGLKEAPIEAVQTLLEREGANLPLANKEALEEYVNAAAAGFFMPIIPATVGGVRTPLTTDPKAEPGDATPDSSIPVTDPPQDGKATEEQKQAVRDANAAAAGTAAGSSIAAAKPDPLAIEDKAKDVIALPDETEAEETQDVIALPDETITETEAVVEESAPVQRDMFDKDEMKIKKGDSLDEMLAKSPGMRVLLENNLKAIKEENEKKAKEEQIRFSTFIKEIKEEDSLEVVKAKNKLAKAQIAQKEKDKKEIDKANEKINKGEKLKTFDELPDTITKEDEAVYKAKEELEQAKASQAVEMSGVKNMVQAENDARTARVKEALEQNKRLEKAREKQTEESVEFTGPTQDRAQAITRAGLPSQPQTQEERDSQVRAQDYYNKILNAREQRRLGPQEISPKSRVFKEEIGLDLTAKGRVPATNKAKQNARKFIKNNNLENTHGIQEVKNDNGVTTAVTVEEKIEVPDILNAKNKVLQRESGYENLSSLIYLMQPNVNANNNQELRSIIENNIPGKQFEYLTRDTKAFGKALNKIADKVKQKQEEGKKTTTEQATEKARELYEISLDKGAATYNVTPASELQARGYARKETRSTTPSVARQEKLFYKNNPVARRALLTKNTELNADLSEAGTATKALKIIENFVKNLIGVNKQGKTVKNRKNKFGFRNLGNLTQMQNVLAETFANLPGLDKTKFVVSKKMKKGVKGTYNTKTDTITISEQNATLETMFHEMTHAATTNELSKHVDVKTGEALTDTGRKLVKILSAARTADTKDRFKNELSNMDEFVTEAINNPTFQRFLADQKNVLPAPPTIQKLWANFVNAVQEMLGMNIEFTLLNDVLAVAPSLIVGSNKTEQGKQPQRTLYQKENATLHNDQAKHNRRTTGNIFKKMYDGVRDAWDGGESTFNNFVTQVQNQSHKIKKLQENMERAGLLIIADGTNTDTYNDIYNSMVTSFGKASLLVRDVLQTPMENFGEALREYKELTAKLGESKDLSQGKLVNYFTALHEPERRFIKYMQKVPLSKEAFIEFTDLTTGQKRTLSPADVRDVIFSQVASKKLTEAQLKRYRTDLEILTNVNTRIDGKPTIDKLDGEPSDVKTVDINADEFKVTKFSAQEVQNLRDEYFALQSSNPEVWNAIQKIKNNMETIKDLTKEFNRNSNYASELSDQVIDFYGWENYIPIKGQQQSGDKADSQYEIDGEMVSGDLRRMESSFEGNLGEAENPFIQILIDSTTAAQRQGRLGLTQAIKNAILNPIKYTDNVTGKEIETTAINGEKLATYTFEQRYGKGLNEQAAADMKKLLKDKKNLVHYNADGSMNVLRIKDDSINEAIKTTYQDQNKFMEVLGDATSFIGQMHTRYNLSFGVTNFVRDFITAAGIISAEKGFGTSASFLSQISDQVARRGMKDSAKMSWMYSQNQMEKMRKYVNDEKAKGNTYPEDYLQYLEQGGMIAYSMGLSTDRAFEKLNKTIEVTKIAKTKEQITSFFDGYMATFELATRVAAYRTIRDNYISKNAPGIPRDQVPDNILQAAKREGTVYAKRLANFEEIGKQGQNLGALFMFFRPSATGAVRSIDALSPGFVSMESAERTLPDIIKRNPEALNNWRKDYQTRGETARATTAALAGAGVALVYLSAMLSGDDDEGRNRILTDDSARWNRYARFDISGITGRKGDVFQIPFGFGMSGIMAIGSQVALAASSQENSLAHGVGNMVEITLDSFLPLPISRMSPIDNPMQFLFTSFMPTIARPPLEYTLNLNTFGQPIYRGSIYGSSRFGDAYAGGDSVGQLYKNASINMAELTNGAVDVSPNTIAFWTNAYVDGAARLVSNLTGLGYTIMGEKDFEVKYDTQLFNSFFSRVSDIDARAYARTKKEVDKTRARINLFKDVNAKEYLDYMKANPYALATVTSFDKMNAQLNKLNAQANIVRRTPGLSPKERRERLDIIKQYQLMLKKGISAQIEFMQSYN